MKFGKDFTTHLEETLPEWRDKYLCYKPLKKLLKNIPAAVNLPADGGGSGGGAPSISTERFVEILNEELEKLNDFYVEKEEEFIIRFQALKERIERLKERGSNNKLFTSETEFGEEMMKIRRDFVAIHGEMVLLKNYSSLNLAGFIKILKKYDKRTGELLSYPFTQLAVHQPFFTTEPLTRLVCECEEKLEVLFPLEAEVVESTSSAQEQMGASRAGVSNASSATSSLLGEETGDIYRSTLAAIRVIQELKKESSTYNPLSLSYLYGNQENDSTGAVTAENSPCDRSINSQNGEEANEDSNSSK